MKHTYIYRTKKKYLKLQKTTTITKNLFEIFHLEIILGHLGQMLLYTFKVSPLIHETSSVLENLILQPFKEI